MTANTYLVAAGVLCVALAAGHTAVGLLWILPRLPGHALPPTPFGRGAMTLLFLEVTWHIVGIAVVSMGGLLLLLARAPLGTAGAVSVRIIGVMFAGCAVLMLWLARDRPRDLVRAPMWMLFLAVAVLCWLGAAAG